MRILLLLVVLISVPAFTQEIASTGFFDFGRWKDEFYQSDLDTAYVFADACNVRKEPKQDAEAITKLLIGTRIRVLQVMDATTTINGVKSNWLKIQSDTVTGYVWGGTITNALLELPDGRIATWGIVKIQGKEESLKVFGSVRLAKNQTVTSYLDFEVTYGDDPTYGQLKLYEKPLLDSVTLCVSYETMSEACGVFSSEHYLLEANNKLIYAGFGCSMGDGGIFHTNRSLVFPTPEKEGKVREYHYTPNPNHVLVVVNTGEYDDECNWIEETTVENYEWKDNKLYKYCEE